MDKRMKIMVFLVSLLFIMAVPARGEDAFTAFGVLRPMARVKAPPFTLKGLDGNAINLEELKGKVVVLNFWASWCRPCRVEMPSLSRLSDEFRNKGLIVLTVAGDRGFFGSRSVKKFVLKYDLTLPVLMDPEGRVRKLYEVAYLPTTYIIGRDGLITGKVTGERVWDGEEAIKFLTALLGP